MSVERTNGGAAFPCPMSEQSHSNQDCGPFQAGMTLRDYFAGKAMVGLCHFWVSVRAETSTISDPDPNIISRMAYEYADAMLKARTA